MGTGWAVEGREGTTTALQFPISPEQVLPKSVSISPIAARLLGSAWAGPIAPRGRGNQVTAPPKPAFPESGPLRGQPVGRADPPSEVGTKKTGLSSIPGYWQPPPPTKTQAPNYPSKKA